MAPADDALKFIDNTKTQKSNLSSSETNLSDIVGDLSQSNKSLDMIPEKLQNLSTTTTTTTSTSDNNNFIEAKNIACTKKFTELQEKLHTNQNLQNKVIESSSEILEKHQQQQSQENNNIKLAKEIDELAKMYHDEYKEIKASRIDNDVTNANILTNTKNNINNNNDDDAGVDADDEDEFEKVFEDSMRNLEVACDNYESSNNSSDESDNSEYFDTTSPPPTSTSLEKSRFTLSSPLDKSSGYIENMISGLPCINKSGGISIETPPIKIASKTNTNTNNGNKNINNKHKNHIKFNNEVKIDNDKTIKKNISDSSDSDEDSPDKIMNEIAKSPKLLPNEMLNNHKMFLFRPYSLPFQERRRLSQCKEEDENEDSDNNKLPSQKSESSVMNSSSDAGNHKNISPNRRDRYSHIRSPPVPESQLMSEKFKELERLRDQFRRKLEEIHPSKITPATLAEFNDDDGINCTISTNLSNTPNLSTNSKIYKGKFVVTRAEDNSSLPTSTASQVPPSKQITQTIITGNDNNGSGGRVRTESEKEVPILRSEAVKLRNLQPQMNSFTIHFPNSKGISGHTRIQSLFAPFMSNGNNSTNTSNDNINNNSEDLRRHTVSFQPHLDKQFFDTSLVEIRPISDSTKSLDTCSDIIKEKDDESNVWLPRPSNSVTPASSRNSVDDQDGSKSAVSSRPSSAPAEPNAKAARKASKKMEKEARRQEKELRNKEKEARKIERETARRLEREQAKLEKLNRNSEKIARSTERLAPRSGSLERRRSGEDSPVLNQSTVHGIASPNRRPTIFDVFRPRTKSDAKRKEKDAAIHSGSEKDNSSTSSNHSGHSGGIMKAMKNVVQNTVGHHRHNNSNHQPEKPSVKYRDGSAHPHGGSDAQYYHTVTAVRRADASRSPMTKVMDLFRYRSNLAVNEADKRKARAVAHQQLLAAQSPFKGYQQDKILITFKKFEFPDKSIVQITVNCIL